MNVPARTQGAIRQWARRSPIDRRVLLPAQAFIHAQTAGSAVLLAAAAAALFWANSPWRAAYFALWHTPITLGIGSIAVSEELGHWINDGLMTLFFFLVALEIKRELVSGELARRRTAALPVVGALGGMALPALLYLLFNAGGSGARGWGIPMATDIAFSLGVLSLLGNRIPGSARVFLLALATVDDIGAILVIALFYSGQLSPAALGAAAFILGVILVMRRSGLRNAGLYTVAGALFWLAVLKSGVHATIAGVILGLLTPAEPWFGRGVFGREAAALLRRFREARRRGDEETADALLGQMEALTVGTEAPLDRIERQLRPWVSYLVLPVFALANSGIAFTGGLLREAVTHPVSLGVLLGLLLGKPLGVFSFAWGAVRAGLAELPPGAGWPHVLGVGLLAGIGYTVSLFITDLAFADESAVAAAKVGIIAASALAGCGGYAFLRRFSPRERPPAADQQRH